MSDATISNTDRVIKHLRRLEQGFSNLYHVAQREHPLVAEKAVELGSQVHVLWNALKHPPQ